MVIMSHTVDSLRKHQRMIILGVALGVIALYIIPVDQIVSALTAPPGIVNAIGRIGDTRARIAANTHIPDDVKARIDAQLASVQDHLSDVLYKIQGL